MKSGLMINEIFYSIQGEGKNCGKPAVFIRLTGCNLRCKFCDTAYAFDSGEDLTCSEVISEVIKYNSEWVCITGGEPFAQDIKELIGGLRREGFNVQIETNGTMFQSVDCEWLVVSPKKEKQPDVLMLEKANEIKLVVDSISVLSNAKKFEKWGTSHFVQPVDNNPELTNLCIDFVKTNPNWQLSMQLHKLIGVR
jgi:7-carboxy-7-deazaguanine synthase